MKNQEIAKIFYEIARFLQIDKVAFKPYAYERAAVSLEAIKDDVAQIYIKGGRKMLEEIEGIGKAMSDHIEEYLKTGKIKLYEEFKKKLPVQMDELVKVEGLGPRKVKVLYQELGIKNIKDLEKAVKKHTIAPLFGFGEKTEKNIMQGLEFLKQSKGRSLISDIKPVAMEVYKKLENLKEVQKISLAGSLRRGKETIGDVDFLVVSRPDKKYGRGSPREAAKNTQKIMDFFVALPGVKKIWGKGGTKASVHMADGFDMDLRIVPEKSYGAALQYFTGSQAHNIATRKIAIDKGLKLSEYGLFKGSKIIAGKTEEEVYRALGLPYIAPELREDQGEIDTALKNTLPDLVELKDIKGDLHCHSNWNGGENSIEVMARSAMDLGYEYIGISDHTKFLKIENGLDEKKLLKQKEAIKKINENYKKKGIKFRVLHGCEANILNDGSIDIKDEVLAQLDYVIAGVHSTLKMEKGELMERIEKAMKNPNVDIFAHPTGRIVGQRDEYQIDFDKILQIAKNTGTILEINSSSRLDLRDLYIRRAKAEGVKMIINTDSHKKEQLLLMEYGAMQARRGWAEKNDIINTLPAEELLKSLK
ncbi:MAG: DNA polymerase III [Candidatus Staskawiczbacteria bacterium RIFCSPHIGHO2_02_FULL_33_16]|uniref:DNA-directed DNA polymerase n=1 Tax=Candidatus Staskawiczbacteria bacterium RIFCSPHIGHO2_02_FULL_33_16 TaxID=1802204 RepID=A0A1G2HUB3_9BACT|nr:MAG: DNA polymerase III [Candidatus Staskawiczbacteria bacterium RIFCSPHIGHO2_02_FULL_33_16]OGZ70804.1 MAG: DNA polymerase III [Candidatus Staskawiczbacteria bacterium RIFCSPLOWO2_01_FULL_33_13]